MHIVQEVQVQSVADHGCIDERIRAVLPNFAAFRDLEQAVKKLSERVESLERNLEKPGEKRE